jgi:hypothetical protein
VAILKKMNYYILIFESIHQVMKAEQLLLADHINCDIIPTPKEFSSDCGMSIRINDSGDMEKIRSLLLTNNLNFQLHEKNTK